MNTVFNKSKNILITKNVNLAQSFWARGKGLLGRDQLGVDEGLWIRPCNNIHTFFMKFAIDCVFLDKSLTVVRVSSDVKPWKIVGPIWRASSVIEFPSGFASLNNIEVGDQLYVGN